MILMVKDRNEFLKKSNFYDFNGKSLNWVLEENGFFVILMVKDWIEFFMKEIVLGFYWWKRELIYWRKWIFYEFNGEKQNWVLEEKEIFLSKRKQDSFLETPQSNPPAKSEQLHTLGREAFWLSREISRNSSTKTAIFKCKVLHLWRLHIIESQFQQSVRPADVYLMRSSIYVRIH